MKSNVSDQLEILVRIYIDATSKCIADVSDLRDLKTIRARVKDEGLSFLTITLPRFCQDFERSLALGYIDPTLFRSFRKNGSIPALLQGMTGLIFDRETGRIKNEDSTSDTPTLVGSIRQICLAFKKVRVDCSPLRVNKALENFISIERELEVFDLPVLEREKFISVSNLLYSRAIRNISPDSYEVRHGPGRTADGFSGNSKYQWQFWNERLEPYFPIIGCAYPIGISLHLDSKEFHNVNVLPVGQEEPVKVVTVPKTLKAPRIIALEPCCMQYAQHGIQAILQRKLESSRFTKGHINFSDQSVNQKLAMISSYDGLLATIDLSDASDRVPRDLALEMFRSNPDLRDSIDACRSTKAKMPNGDIISPLRKFASMGSALCFPIEAMYFYAICVMALLEFNDLPVTPRNVFRVSRKVYVYGDDIIVPTDAAMTVLEHLRKYNCKVNASKTFVSGSFRESCGVDAFRGESVTPTYLRWMLPKNRQESAPIISYVAAANSFYLKGYWQTAQFLFNKLERIVGSIPYGSDLMGGLHRISYLGYRSVERWNYNLHRFEVRTLVPGPVRRTDVLEGYGALVKSLQNLEDTDPFEDDFSDLELALNISFLKLDDLKNRPVSRDALHLERSAQHHAVALKRGWVPAS